MSEDENNIEIYEKNKIEDGYLYLHYIIVLNDFEYKLNNSLEERKKEVAIFFEKYPGKIPILIEKVKGSRAPSLENNKFLLNGNEFLSSFVSRIEKRLKLDKNISLKLINVCGQVLDANETIGEISKKYKDEDGHLYLYYDIEEQSEVKVEDKPELKKEI